MKKKLEKELFDFFVSAGPDRDIWWVDDGEKWSTANTDFPEDIIAWIDKNFIPKDGGKGCSHKFGKIEQWVPQPFTFQPNAVLPYQRCKKCGRAIFATK